jgi:subtilisin family serine protease
MVTLRYGGKQGPEVLLDEANDLLVVRTESRNALNVVPMSSTARDLLDDFAPIARFRHAGVEVFRTRSPRQPKSLRDRTRSVLKKEPAIEFAGRVLCDPGSKSPVIYTENLFVKFQDKHKASTCKKLLAQYDFTIKRELEYAQNGYFVEAPKGIGTKVFTVAAKLLREDSVELCHPELVRQLSHRKAFLPQWHLFKTTINGKVIAANASVTDAWGQSQGAGITIALIDDGVDLDHEEFSSPGKLVQPRDVTRKTDDPRPGDDDNHGTACAGVACADGTFGASGVAPKAKLMPIRLASDLGSQDEADAFHWAATNGADVISCSWGPQDGKWWDPNDPLHSLEVPLPDSTRLAIDWAINNGRGGKGCVICWAAGNGNESVDNDGYASNPKVIAVAACNDASKRSAYSDKGEAVWCAFPSNDGVPSKTPGIWTTDRSGAPGYNPGQVSRGDEAGNYTNSFGGTSSAAPGAAGVAALVLARNSSLRWDQVKDILKRCCDRIDKADGDYDSNGHSPFYGYGRLNAKKAVELAGAIP